MLPRLYAIADAAFGDPVEIARRLFAGGVRLVQVRSKVPASGLLLAQCRAVVAAAPLGARVIVNDRADIARIAHAAGLHVGQGDLPPALARVIIGDDPILGLSTHDEQQVRDAAGEPIDYIAVGPVFPTQTKPDTAPALGLEGLARLVEITTHPIVAIGGIRLENAPDVIRAGASSVAVISDLIGVADIERRARQFVTSLAEAGSV